MRRRRWSIARWADVAGVLTAALALTLALGPACSDPEAEPRDAAAAGDVPAETASGGGADDGGRGDGGRSEDAPPGGGPHDGAGPGEDGDVGGDAGAAEAAPALRLIEVRPPGEKTLHHLDCALNRAGAGVAVWRETDLEGRSQVWASQLPGDGRGWQPARALNSPALLEIDRLGVTVDEQGRALVVWNESGGAAEAAVAGARYLPDGGWSPAARIAGGWVLSLVGSAAGDAVAFGALEGTPPALIRFSPADGWTVDSAFRPERPGFFFASPVGLGILGWNQPVAPGSASELLLSEYRPGGQWSAPRRLQEASPFDHPSPLVNGALAADGSGLLIWNRGGEVRGDLWASASPAPGSWQPPHRLNDGEAALWTTSVLVTPGGDGLVAWETGVAPRRKVWAALHRAGTWQPSLHLGDGSDLVAAAVDPSGAALVGWSTPAGVFARRRGPAPPGDDAWSPTLPGPHRYAGVADLCAAIDASGHGWLVWIGSSPQVIRAAAVGP